MVAGPVDSDVIPALVFDAALIAPQHQFDVFREGAAAMMDTAPITEPSVFRSSVTDCLVDDLVVTRARNDAHVLRRDRRHVGAGDTDWITVQLYVHGGATGHVGDDAGVALRPGGVGLMDMAHAFTLTCTPSDAIWVCIPRDRIEAADALAAGDGTVAIDDAPRRDALRQAILDLWRGIDEAPAHDAPVLAGALVDTVNRVLRPDHYVRTPSEVRAALDRHIAASLDDLTLDVDALVERFHYSRTSIYRLFEPDGGVARYIRRLRLRHCLAELTEPSAPTRRVSEIATAWGFENPSHFNRLFKAEFGVPPSAVLADPSARPEPIAPPATVEVLHSWLRSSGSDPADHA